MKINRIRASMIVTLSFFIEMSITAMSFYWRNDTTSFVTWRSRLATTPDTPTCIVIHGGQFTGRDHRPQISSSLRLLVLCHVRPHMFVVHYRLFIFSKNLFLPSPPVTNANVFNALIFFEVLVPAMAFYDTYNFCHQKN